MNGMNDNNTDRVTRWKVLPVVVLAIAALLAVLPLLMHGYSCGHDFDFHLRSWMEASTQWKHGILKPVWAFHAAWNAGEPRFLFYPPLSWMTGAFLTVLLPWKFVSAAFTWLVLFLSGLTMYRLLQRWTSPGVATLGGCLYLVNPYMLFCAYERTAYAELMAAAWMPLLLAAILRPRLSAWRIAVAVALLWLTNAPAAVVGCYTILLLGIGRLIMERREGRQHALRTITTVTGGVVMGLLLDAFYLIPMVVERRFVQLNLAIVPNAQPNANFLFDHTGDEFHDGVLLHSSSIGVGLVIAAVVCGVALWLLRRRVKTFHSMHDRDLRDHSIQCAVPVLVVYSIIVMFLLMRQSAPIWHVAPELIFLQFPWRFLAMQSGVSVTVVCLLIHRLTEKQSRLHLPSMAVSGLLIAVLAGFLGADTTFRQGCDDEEGLAPQLAAFHHGEGFEQTDEYTPVGADNDELNIKLPAARLAPAADWMPEPRNGDGALRAGEIAPREEDLRPDDIRFVMAAPAAGEFLIVRIRAFRGWHVMRDGSELKDLPERTDGLIAVPLGTGGVHQVEVRYRKTADQWIGGGVSVLCVGVLLGVYRRKRPAAAGAAPVS